MSVRVESVVWRITGFGQNGLCQHVKGAEGAKDTHAALEIKGDSFRRSCPPFRKAK